jgi:hypothetical protein
MFLGWICDKGQKKDFISINKVLFEMENLMVSMMSYDSQLLQLTRLVINSLETL